MQYAKGQPTPLVFRIDARTCDDCPFCKTGNTHREYSDYHCTAVLQEGVVSFEPKLTRKNMIVERAERALAVPTSCPLADKEWMDGRIRAEVEAADKELARTERELQIRLDNVKRERAALAEKAK